MKRYVKASSKPDSEIVITDIEWDTYDEELGKEIDVELPDKLIVPVSDIFDGDFDKNDPNLDEAIADYLSDEYGFLLYRFNFKFR